MTTEQVLVEMNTDFSTKGFGPQEIQAIAAAWQADAIRRETMLDLFRRAPAGAQRIPVALYVRKDNRAPRLIKLIATCGPLDFDDPQPAITVMMPGED